MEKKLTRTQKLTRTAIFAGITLLLALTPLGYIPVYILIPLLPLTITIMVLPVALGGLAVGWPTGLALGLIFGISSFFRAPTEPLGMILLAQSPLASFITCVVPRALVGLLADFAGAIIRKNHRFRNIFFYGLTGFAASMCNTVLFLGAIWLLFDTAATGFTLPIIGAVVAFNGVIEAVANAIFTAVLGRVILRKASVEAPQE